MKKILPLIALAVLTAVNTQAQIVVKVRPSRPAVVIAKPAKANRGHVWIDGHWVWNKKCACYRWKKGHWVKARRGHAYVPGHWKSVNGGHKWVPGHWKRR